MPNWTRFDPGAGDLTACDRAKQWTDSQASDLADARSAVSAILRDLDDIWTGESADAFRARILEFHDRLEASEEAMRIAGKGILAYADTVAEITRRAAPLKHRLEAALKHRLEAAELILNGVHSETLFGTDPEGLARRFDAEQQATIDAQDAADELARLADERGEADRILAVLLARTAAEAWGGLDCTATPSDRSPRELANGRAGELLDDFFSGRDGARGVVLGPDDPFVTVLMHSDHINGARVRVLDALRGARLVEGGNPSTTTGSSATTPRFSFRTVSTSSRAGFPAPYSEAKTCPSLFSAHMSWRCTPESPSQTEAWQ